LTRVVAELDKYGHLIERFDDRADLASHKSAFWQVAQQRDRAQQVAASIGLIGRRRHRITQHVTNFGLGESLRTIQIVLTTTRRYGRG